MVGNLAKPFPYQEQWNWSPQQLEALYAEDNSDRDEDGPLLSQYWSSTDGAFPLCHMGCALRVWLVVSGSEVGTVWEDLRVDYKGWKPITFPDGKHMTFADWYLDWTQKELST